MSEKIQLKQTVFALDCDDAQRLAEFYAELLGWDVIRPAWEEASTPEWFDVVNPNDVNSPFKIACQTVENYRAPQWPGNLIPAQAHLDFHVPSIAEALPHALAAGAVQAKTQPSEDGDFMVMLDPVGHPFCLCEVE